MRKAMISTQVAVALHALDESAGNLSELEGVHANTVQLAERMCAIYISLAKKVAHLAIVAQKTQHQSRHTRAPKQTNETSVESLLRFVARLQEENQSFNLQYLQLQQWMQDENRQFALQSNIMKTKHDTAKNSISNLR